VTREGHEETRDPVRELGCEMLARQLRELRRNVPGTLEGRDPEFLHDMRVATRRIRAALRLFRDELGREPAGRLRSEFGWLGKLLGSARDLDVFGMRLPAQLARVEADPVSAARILELVEARRAEARAELGLALRSERYRGLVGELDRFSAGERRENALLREAREAAGKRCRKALSRVRRWRETDDPAVSADALHRLRIDLKHLRYASEFFLDGFGVDARGALRRIVAFQDCLGTHNDAVVGMQLLEYLAAGLDPARDDCRALLLVLGALVEVERQDAAQARTRFRHMWPKLPKRLRRLRRRLV